jgi:hypothetical protein
MPNYAPHGWPRHVGEVCCEHAASVPTAYSAVVIPASTVARMARQRMANERLIESPCYSKRSEGTRSRPVQARHPSWKPPPVAARPRRQPVEHGTTCLAPVDKNRNRLSAHTMAPGDAGHRSRSPGQRPRPIQLPQAAVGVRDRAYAREAFGHCHESLEENSHVRDFHPPDGDQVGRSPRTAEVQGRVRSS